MLLRTPPAEDTASDESSATAESSIVAVTVDIVWIVRIMYALSFGPVIAFAVFEQIGYYVSEKKDESNQHVRSHTECVASRAALGAETAYYLLFLLILFATLWIQSATHKKPQRAHQRIMSKTAAKMTIITHVCLFIYERTDRATGMLCDSTPNIDQVSVCGQWFVEVTRIVTIIAWIAHSVWKTRADTPRRSHSWTKTVKTWMLYAIVALATSRLFRKFVTEHALNSQKPEGLTTVVLSDTVNIAALWKVTMAFMDKSTVIQTLMMTDTRNCGKYFIHDSRKLKPS